MNLAIQHTLLPGVTLRERFERAAEYGFAGIELAAWGFQEAMPDYIAEIQGAVRASGLTISSLCTFRDDDFVHPDPAERERRLNGLVRLLKFADEIGASGVVCVPIRQPISLPDLSPVADERTLTDQLLLAMLNMALERTPDARAAIFLEPLNRYETRFLRTVGHAAEICTAVGNPRVRVMADLFHMSIEEAHTDAALREVIEHVGHVHLADSNRLLPGHGHTDFVAPFRVLKGADFGGWFALECGVPGDPAETMPAAVRYLRDCWAQA